MVSKCGNVWHRGDACMDGLAERERHSSVGARSLDDGDEESVPTEADGARPGPSFQLGEDYAGVHPLQLGALGAACIVEVVPLGHLALALQDRLDLFYTWGPHCRDRRRPC